VGQLIPEDFPMELLKNDAERVVVDCFARTLFSNWLVVPDVGMRGRDQDHQTDIILIHPDMGVVVVEVKGHRVGIRDGIWIGQEGTPLKPQPLDQAKNNSMALQRLIRREIPGLEHLDVVYGIAFPNSPRIAGELTPDIDLDQILLASDMDDADEPIERLVATRRSIGRSLESHEIEAIVKLLRPDADFEWDANARANITRQRLGDLCDAQISSLVSLTENRRVIARGGAGTGKTRLAVQWARKVWGEGDNVLLTCFNDPLASSLVEQFEIELDEYVHIGPFMRLALELPGMPHLEVPPNADRDWWNTVAIGHINLHWPEVGVRFDTIIIDEAQDFSPAWIALLEALLDPDGRRRVLLLADEGQGIYEKGFVFPQADDGWVQVELQSNFRNAHRTAQVLRRVGGPGSPQYVPEGFVPVWHQAVDIEGAAGIVDAELERIIEDEQRSASSVCVATLHTDVRDALRKSCQLVRWEDRGDGAVVCENIHRLKGLEFDTVILVGIDPKDADRTTLLYIGVSRAVSELIVVGAPEVSDRLGLS
jgi:hypothetical protein